jgi:hypothetical protein
VSRPLSVLALERRYRAKRSALGTKTRVLKLDGLTPAQAAEFDARCVARQISRTEAVMELVREDTHMREMAQ